MAREHKLVLGKVDYNGSGRRNCKAAITWKLENGNFSMCAEIWNPRETDIYCGGQCVDMVAGYFKGNRKAQRMVEIWKRWHLNDLCAGSPAQRAQIEKYKAEGLTNFDYSHLCELLERDGLNPDPSNGYRYGSAWLREEIPADVIAEIESWSNPQQVSA